MIITLKSKNITTRINSDHIVLIESNHAARKDAILLAFTPNPLIVPYGIGETIEHILYTASNRKLLLGETEITLSDLILPQ